MVFRDAPVQGAVIAGSRSAVRQSYTWQSARYTTFHVDQSLYFYDFILATCNNGPSPAGASLSLSRRIDTSRRRGRCSPSSLETMRIGRCWTWRSAPTAPFSPSRTARASKSWTLRRRSSSRASGATRTGVRRLLCPAHDAAQSLSQTRGLPVAMEHAGAGTYDTPTQRFAATHISPDASQFTRLASPLWPCPFSLTPVRERVTWAWGF